MMLLENPFAVLGASPRDSRQRLTELADEAALLGGASVDDALASLMQMNRRITAEVAWLPGAEKETADAFLRYAEAVSAGRSEKLPPLERLGTPLAQANALAAFFQAWPNPDSAYMIGLARSLDLILSKVNTAETFAALNEDRQAGGWEPIPDEMTLAGPLEERLRELTKLARERLEKTVIDAEVLKTISQLMNSPDFDQQGTVAQELMEVYRMRIHDKEEIQRQRILAKLKTCADAPSFTSLNNIKSEIASWCSLTEPLRKVPGATRREATAICHQTRECIVGCVNRSTPKQERVVKTVPTFQGTKTITLTYQSKKDAYNQAMTLNTWLIGQFPDQADQIALLQNDQKTLRDLIHQEERNVQQALMKAH